MKDRLCVLGQVANYLLIHCAGNDHDDGADGAAASAKS